MKTFWTLIAACLLTLSTAQAQGEFRPSHELRLEFVNSEAPPAAVYSVVNGQPFVVKFQVVAGDEIVQVLDYALVDASGNAVVTKNQDVPGEFTVTPNANTNGAVLDLQVWAEPQGVRWMQPVAREKKLKTFDENSKVLTSNVLWQPVDLNAEGKLLFSTVRVAVGDAANVPSGR